MITNLEVTSTISMCRFGARVDSEGGILVIGGERCRRYDETERQWIPVGHATEGRASVQMHSV